MKNHLASSYQHKSVETLNSEKQNKNKKVINNA